MLSLPRGFFGLFTDAVFFSFSQSTFFSSTLSRSIAGLIYSANPDTSPNATAFVLGTSPVQSTEFYLMPSNSSDADPSTDVVNIPIPILNSQTLTTTDFCATFDLAPPSPLSLLPCGVLTGFSQSTSTLPPSPFPFPLDPDFSSRSDFAYDWTTSELQPLYSATPAPMALVDTSAGMETFSPVNSSPSAAEEEAVNQLDDADTEPAQTISLFFVPASTYYAPAQPIEALFDNTAGASSSSSS